MPKNKFIDSLIDSLNSLIDRLNKSMTIDNPFLPCGLHGECLPALSKDDFVIPGREAG